MVETVAALTVLIGTRREPATTYEKADAKLTAQVPYREKIDRQYKNSRKLGK